MYSSFQIAIGTTGHQNSKGIPGLQRRAGNATLPTDKRKN